MIAQTKAEIRAEFKCIRARAMREDPSLETRVREELAAWLAKQTCRSIGFYWPMHSEPGVVSVVRAWLKADSDRMAGLPVVDDAVRGVMHYANWSARTLLRDGAFGIPVPAEDVPMVPDMVFAPCLAFTDAGVRLGAGGGFFDRYLKNRTRSGSGPVTVLIAFEALRSEGLMPESHDIVFDWIATEDGVRRAHQ